MKQAMCVGVVAGLLALSGTASAQETVGKQGDIALGIERAMGIYAGHTSYDFPGGKADTDYTGIEVGLRGNPVIPSNTVRFAFDVFVIDHLSVGGGIGFASYSSDNNGPDSNLFLIAPRVGYFLNLGQHFGFWPRGGFTFWTEGGTPSDSHQIMVTGEGMFTIAPNETYAFMVGPFFDLGFAGSREAGPVDVDRTDRLLGISIGMVGFL